MRVAILIAAVLVALPMPAEAGKTKVYLELDYIEGQEKPPKPKKLNRWFADVGIKVKGDLDENSAETAQDACVSRATVEEMLMETRSPDKAGDKWYAHGLVLSGDCFWLWDKVTQTSRKHKYAGMFWALDDENGEPGLREAFVILDDNFEKDDNGYREKKWVIAHELAHVLNAHHCEFDQDGWKSYDAEFGEWTKLHFDRRETHPDEVKPGGDPWCDISDWHNEKIHGPNYCGDDCGEYSGQAYDYPQDVALSVKAEKSRYFPGEPIYVNLSLQAAGRLSGKLYYNRDSLDPASPYLTLRVGKSRSSLRPLPRTILGLGAPDLVELRADQVLQATDLDAWLNLPKHWVEWTGSEKPLWIQASYTMFQPTAGARSCRGLEIANCRRVRIDSDPIKLVVGLDTQNTGLFDAAAHKAFTSRQARRYLWLRGGRHLGRGKTDLEQVAGQHKNTIYGAYSEMALGLGIMARKPRLGDQERKDALSRLEAAERLKLRLPPSRRRFLEEQLRRVRTNPNP